MVSGDVQNQPRSKADWEKRAWRIVEDFRKQIFIYLHVKPTSGAVASGDVRLTFWAVVEADGRC